MNNKSKKLSNLYVSLVVILMAVAVVAAIAGAMNRSRQNIEDVDVRIPSGTDAAKDEETDKTVEDVFKPSKDKETEAVTDKETEAQTEKTEAEPLPEFINPTGGELLNEFSIEVPVFSVTMEDYRTHNGVDIFVSKGERILAAASGTVKDIWEDPMMGSCISISHGGGAESIYKNVSSEFPEGIEVGAKVSEGTMIAVGGESALAEISEEPHVHFEMKVNGEYVDPCDYIDFSKAEEVYEG